jgi:hypothetical protein
MSRSTVDPKRRTHNLLLIEDLSIPAVSRKAPFTLILDSAEQSSAPVIQEFLRRAKVGRADQKFSHMLSRS